MSAQETITIDNFQHLQPVARLDFAEHEAVIGTFATGWFALSPNGSQIVATNQDQAVLHYDWHEQILEMYPPPEAEFSQFIDATYSADGTRWLRAYSDGATIDIFVHTQEMETERFTIPSNDFVHEVWFSDTAVWLEMERVLTGELYLLEVKEALPSLHFNTIDIREHDYSPAIDKEAVVRIGRIEVPAVITASMDGRVKQWNLETGTVLTESQVDMDLGVPSFGQLETNQEYLVWRDPLSEQLNLLQLATGENQAIAPLDGRYVQAFFVPNHDLILGINVDFEPVVLAWDVATGAEVYVGDHFACNRVPDMIRVSVDNTTLAIGCDTGIEFWQIVDES